MVSVDSPKVVIEIGCHNRCYVRMALSKHTLPIWDRESAFRAIACTFWCMLLCHHIPLWDHTLAHDIIHVAKRHNKGRVRLSCAFDGRTNDVPGTISCRRS